MRSTRSFGSTALRIALAWIPAFASLAASVVAHAGADPDRFAVQIRLDRSTVPVIGTVDLRLAVFAAATGGTALSSTELPATAFIDGLAAVRIDTGGPLPPEGAWIEAEVSEPGAGEYVRLQPRIAVGTSPLALVAATIPPAAIDAAAVRRTQVQLRVQDCLAATDRVFQIGDTGVAFCVPDRIGVVDVVTTPGLLRSVAGNQIGLSIDPALVQRRVVSSCMPGSSIAAIGSDGSTQCLPDRRITAANLQTVTASCDVDPTVGVVTQCTTQAFCPSNRPFPVSVGFGTNCVGSNVPQLAPIETPMGLGFVTTMFKDQNTQCSGVPARHTLYITCAPPQ